MIISRRSFLATASSLAPLLHSRALAAKLEGVRIGVTDWDFGRVGKIESIAVAKSLGFEGVQLRLDREKGTDRLALENPELQASYLAESKRQNLPLAGTSLAGLQADPKQSGKLGERWVASGIAITRNLHAGVLLVPLFFKDVPSATASDYAVALLKDMAPEAQKSGVVMGLENWLSAEDNVRIMDRIQSPAVRMYYDVGITTRLGLDAPKEIRWLGRNRVAQFHLKDDVRYFGEGKVDFAAVLRAIADIGYEGFANLEKSGMVRSSSVEDDMRRNLIYIRNVIEQVRRA
jgi:sugar phosphate isomerase/epimerase